MYAQSIYTSVPVNSKFVCDSTCCTVAATPPTCATWPSLYGDYAPCVPYGPLPFAAPCNPISRLVRNDGWVEVGWIVSECRVLPPKPNCHDCHDCHCNDQKCKRQNHGRRHKPEQWQPRADYQCNSRTGCSNSRCEEYWHENSHTGGPQITCRTRRYRLYARPAYGWRGSCDANLLQYAVTEESIARCDAIFVVLADDPRLPFDGHEARRYRYGNQRFQPLQSYDRVFVPGECDPFIVHLYADEWHH